MRFLVPLFLLLSACGSPFSTGPDLYAVEDAAPLPLPDSGKVSSPTPDAGPTPAQDASAAERGSLVEASALDAPGEASWALTDASSPACQLLASCCLQLGSGTEFRLSCDQAAESGSFPTCVQALEVLFDAGPCAAPQSS